MPPGTMALKPRMSRACDDCESTLVIVMDDEIFQIAGLHWSEEIIEALADLPGEEMALLMRECRDIVLGLEPLTIIDLAEQEIQEDRHIILRMLVHPVANRLGLQAGDELLKLKRKLEDEARFWQMME